MKDKEIKDPKHYIDVEDKKIPFKNLPCAKCERQSALCCPKPDCCNKAGKYL